MIPKIIFISSLLLATALTSHCYDYQIEEECNRDCNCIWEPYYGKPQCTISGKSCPEKFGLSQILVVSICGGISCIFITIIVCLIFIVTYRNCKERSYYNKIKAYNPDGF